MYQESPESRQRTEALVAEFSRRYQGEPILVRAPGRVNLIGEHTDYNDGYVLPIAIDQDVRLAVARNHESRTVRLYSLDFQAETCFDLDHVGRDEGDSWGNYLRGMAVELTRCGVLLHGLQGVIQGNVPVGSGLSSSAATTVASGLAYLAVSQQEVEPTALAELAQDAENNFMGVHVGIMDPFASRMGHPGHAIFLDCRTREYHLVPVPGDEYVFVVANSKQSRELAGSAYNERRSQCEAAVAHLQKRYPQVKALRDVTLEQLEQARDELDPVVYRRARHVITENNRVLQAVQALRGDDLPTFGRLMNESHDSLRDDYEVSSPALDSLVNAARKQEGCLGSRLTGAGFGGCTVSLVRQDRVDDFRARVTEIYRQECGRDAELYVTRPAAGAGYIVPPR